MWKLRVVVLAAMVAVGVTAGLAQACEIQGPGLKFCLEPLSPSVQPGCTPYVRTDQDLHDFLARIDAYCEFFLGEIGGVASTPEEFRRTLAESAQSTAEERRS